MIDRNGTIAQFRVLDQGAAHVGPPWIPQYIGIEHIATWRGTARAAGSADRLTANQIDASADLLNLLNAELSFPLSELSAKGSNGIGRHSQFEHTGRAGPLTVAGTGEPGPDFKSILAGIFQRSPIGDWAVTIGDKDWTYTFTLGSAEWHNDAGERGTGTWQRGADNLLTTRWNSGSVEKWELPFLSMTNAKATLVQPGRADIQSVDATRTH